MYTGEPTSNIFALDSGPTTTDNTLHNLSVKGHAIDQIADDDDVIGLKLLHVLNNGFKRRKVAVYIR